MSVDKKTGGKRIFCDRDCFPLKTRWLCSLLRQNGIRAKNAKRLEGYTPALFAALLNPHSSQRHNEPGKEIPVPTKSPSLSSRARKCHDSSPSSLLPSAGDDGFAVTDSQTTHREEKKTHRRKRE